MCLIDSEFERSATELIIVEAVLGTARHLDEADLSWEVRFRFPEVLA